MSSPLFWIMLGFGAGSIPFSMLIGTLILGKDIRRFGDGNPGGTNVVRAGGKRWGGLAVLLDALKGAIPVGLAVAWIGMETLWLVPIALAPVLGHAFSPFLQLRGGKAVATTFGVWTGLTLWVGPLALGIFLLLAYRLFKVDGWAVMGMMVGLLLVGVGFMAFSLPLLLIWLGNVGLLAWKHRADLRQPPGLRFLSR